MAITRRQFVTRLGALAAAAGFSQAQASQIMDALAYTASSPYKGTLGKPRVVWIHGAECTGCSTSLLGIFENTSGPALYNTNGTTKYTTAAAAGLAKILPTDTQIPLGNTSGGFLYHDRGFSPDQMYPTSLDIVDLVVDIVDIVYHETIMGMGGDLAYQWLNDFVATNTDPFVLVVEGALQKKTNGGAWNDTAGSGVPWCSIGMGNATGETDMPTMVTSLAEKTSCAAVIAIGQCATFGGYPGCKSPLDATTAGFNTTVSQTEALGVFDYLTANGTGNAAARAITAGKVVNVPGCPTNPWWFVLSVVAWMVDFGAVVGAANGTVGPLGILTKKGASGTNMGVYITGGVDGTRRLSAVYGNPIHSPLCPRYRYYTAAVYAAKPGDTGCLQKLGCKGPSAKSLCGVHGWNNQQPSNVGGTGDPTNAGWDYGTAKANKAPNGTTPTGGHCTRAGAPCMACTEKGYPDSFVPFVVR